MDSQIGRLWTARDVAEFLGVPIATIYQWRYQGYGPRGRRVGRYVRFDPDDVRAWFEAQDNNDVA